MIDTINLRTIVELFGMFSVSLVAQVPRLCSGDLKHAFATFNQQMATDISSIRLFMSDAQKSENDYTRKYTHAIVKFFLHRLKVLSLSAEWIQVISLHRNPGAAFRPHDCWSGKHRAVCDNANRWHSSTAHFWPFSTCDCVSSVFTLGCELVSQPQFSIRTKNCDCIGLPSETAPTG